jgi:hypothetical protein
MTTTRLTEAQLSALGNARDGSVTGHARTIRSLCALGYAEPVEGWYEKSVARRVGRYAATSTTWGVVGHRITEAGRQALADAKTSWRRVAPRHYVRPTGEGEEITARIVSEPERRGGGLIGPERWTAWIYPSHSGWTTQRQGLPTIKAAQAWAQQALREAEEEIAAERSAGRLLDLNPGNHRPTA